MPQQLEIEGFALLSAVYSATEVAAFRDVLSEMLQREQPNESVRHRAGAVFAARNVLDLAPELIPLALKPDVAELVSQVLGPRAGLVRGLFFDKPPERTWALPWHKDLSIAARPQGPASPRYSPVRLKAGVPHLEPPVEVLERMLTLRIHLDPATESNGPLEVWPRSHTTGKTLVLEHGPPVTILSAAGDVLVMRPLLAHASGLSHSSASMHRRVLHLEFAAGDPLPDGYAWHRFTGVRPAPSVTGTAVLS